MGCVENDLVHPDLDLILQMRESKLVAAQKSLKGYRVAWQRTSPVVVVLCLRPKRKMVTGKLRMDGYEGIVFDG